LATGDPIARGNIILGADTTPLEAGLSAAKEQAKAAGQEIQQAAAGGDDSAAYQTRLQEMAAASEMERRSREALAAEADRMARAERNRLREIANADAASATAATVQTSRWQRMRAALNGVNADVGELQKSLGIIGRVGGIAAALSAAVVGAYQLGRTLREYVVNVLETGTQKAQNFKDTLDLANVPESLGKVRSELDQVNARLEAAASGSFGGFMSLLLGDTTAKLQEQRTELEKLVISLNKAAKARENYNKRIQDQARYEAEIVKLQQQIQAANQASFARIEASVEKIGQYVELMSRTIRRNG
jgi:hypothetical protein